MKFAVLKFTRKDSEFKVILGCSSLLEVGEDLSFLSESDINRLSSISNTDRRREFYTGRFLCFKAIQDLSEDPIMLSTGVMKQPVVLQPGGLGVSISHSSEEVAVLSFPSEHPVAIDVERVNPNRITGISSRLTNLEQRVCEQDSILFTVFWSVKEALSKMLKTGLMVNFDFLEINCDSLKINLDESLADSSDTFSGCMRINGSFQHLSQYRWEAIVKNEFCYSIVFPKYSESNFSSVLHHVTMNV